MNRGYPRFLVKKMKFILGKKIKMSQIFDEQGRVIPITLVEAGPCQVTQVKTDKKDGYEAVQIKFGKKLREFDSQDFKVGDKITVGIFNPGEIVKVSGISKGKGFQGVVKRHGFSGADATHGTKHNERAPGSIGSAFPERVFKGKRMAGRMGSDRITTKGLEVILVDEKENTLAIKGALPGKPGTLLEIVATKEIDKPKEEKKEEAPKEEPKKEEEKKESKEEEKKDK